MRAKSTRFHKIRQQRGVVAVLVTVSMTVLLGFAALAIDVNHWIFNKSRAQNGVDSAALSASMALEQGASLAQAANAAVDTIKAVTLASGNNELALDVTGAQANSAATKEYSFQSSNGAQVVVQFSNNPITFPAAQTLDTTADIYTRVAIEGYPLNSFFIQLFGTNKSVSASAVSGRSSGLSATSNIAPIGVCEQGASNFGYQIGTEYQLAGKTNGNSSSCKKDCDDIPNSGDIGAGNYNYLRLDGYGNGANGVGDAIGGKPPGEFAEGETGLYYVGGTVDTKPGVNNGPVSGFNSRWNIESGFPSPDTDTSSNTYSEYVSNGKGNGRRTFVVPVVDCSNSSNGSSSLNIVGFACFYLTQQYDKKEKIIWGEFYTNGCAVPNGSYGLTPSATGPYKIQLYRDLTTGDS